TRTSSTLLCFRTSLSALLSSVCTSIASQAWAFAVAGAFSFAAGAALALGLEITLAGASLVAASECG
ncbi:unnamed protein product, partial [Tilletia controversa]